MKHPLTLLALSVLALASCTSSTPPPESPEAPVPVMDEQALPPEDGGTLEEEEAGEVEEEPAVMEEAEEAEEEEAAMEKEEKDLTYCETDSDCMEATCCHPTEVVNKRFAPDCSGTPCTMSCVGPLDCGAGRPACENNRCTIEERMEESSSSPSSSAAPAAMAPTKRVIAVTADNWLFSPSLITVKKGEVVELAITGAGGTHGFTEPELGINVPISVGETKTVTVPTANIGTFAGLCSIPCGSGHSNMKVTIIVTE